MQKGNSNEKYCEYNNFKKNRYFHGKLMTDRDFMEEQLYHIEKRKLLNKMLHGSGVVCGLTIAPSQNSGSVLIKPGLALDCEGNEIFVPEEYTLNVADIIKSNSESHSGTECDDIEEGDSKKWYVVIKYKQITTDLAPVHAPGGGCDDKICEPSRIREGYCIDLLDTSPECCQPKEKQDYCTSISGDENIRKFICESLLMPWEKCSDNCCENNYIVLGSITILMDGNMNPKTITSEMINNWDCRKYVISFRLLQHWIELLPPDKFNIKYINEYYDLSDGCNYGNSGIAVDTFNYFCENAGKVESVQQKKKYCENYSGKDNKKKIMDKSKQKT